MRRPLAASSFVLGSLLLAAPSCKVSVGNTAQPATGSDPVAKPPKGADDGQQGKTPTRTNPGKAAVVSTWGHFVMADPEKTLKRMGEQLAPPMMGAMISPSQLKSMLAMQLESRGEVVKHIDLTKPFGCVMVNPKQHDQPVVCAVGFEGGVDQLVQDLGQEGYLSGGDGFASYELGGETFYFKGWGDHVGVALDPSLLASVEPAMNEVVKPGKADRDFYMEAKPSVIMVDARQEIETFYAEMESAMSTSGPGAPGSEYASASAKAAMDMYRSLGDLTSAEFVLRIGKQRTKMLYRGTAAEGTPTAKQYERDAQLPQVDTAMIDALPDDAWFVGGLNFDFAHIMDDPWVGPYMKMLGNLKAPDGTDVGGKMKAFMASLSETLAGPSAMAVFPVKGSIGAAGVTYVVKPGQDSMAVMRAFLPTYKAEVFMPTMAEYITSSYKKDAFTVAGAKVDTYTVAPTKKALAELRKDSDFAKMKKVFGELKFTIAYMQKGDRQYMVMTTAKAKQALERMLRAEAGKGNLGKFGDAHKRVQKNAEGSTLLMLDVKGMLTWLRSLDVDGSLSDVPKVGIGLDDVVWTTSVNKQGKKEYELAVSQPFIDQVRSL